MNKTKSRSTSLVQSIRNVSRFREILSVFVKNGFEEFIYKSKLHEIIPNFVFPASKKEQILANAIATEQWWGAVGHRLRLSFEELGPAFIKFGQLLGTRDDFFAAAFTQEMKKLQDDVKGISWSEAKDQIEKCWKKDHLDVCSEITHEPIASASIASVFTAKLKNGEKVVIKVKRQGIDQVIESDFQLMSVLVRTLENTSEQFRWMALSRTLEEFYRSIKSEINFTYELKNLERLRSNLAKVKDSDILVLPKPFPELSNESVLVMEFLEGLPFSKLTPSDVTKELQNQLLKCVQLFLHSMLKDGFFHADLHGGNFFSLKNGKIGVVDFGLVGTLSQKNKNTFMSILYNLSIGDFDRLVYELLDVAEYDKVPDYHELSRDLEIALSPFLVLSASQIPSAEFMQNLVSILSKYRIFLPREWSIIFRALVTLDGVGRSLGIDIKVFEILDSSTKEFTSTLINKDQIIMESLWFLKDSMSSLRMWPKHVNWFLREFSKNNYSFDIKIKSLSRDIFYAARSIQFLAHVIGACSLLFMGLYFVEDKSSEFNNLPFMTTFFWILATLLFVFGLWNLRGKNRH
jgi:ubiquinone biosynthesis protein